MASRSKAPGQGRVGLARIDEFSTASLHRFIDANAAATATVRTDGWPAYPGLPAEHHGPHLIGPHLIGPHLIGPHLTGPHLTGPHLIGPHLIGPTVAHLVLSWVHRVFSNLKTWALGVYHGLREKHLQSCLDEFVFPFNRRRTRHAAFHALLGIGMRVKPPTCKMLTSPEMAGYPSFTDFQ